MADKKLTMGDIAKLAGVGKSTVSRYFNNGYVKEETREKIKKVIDENHYEPNALAQIMKAKQSKIIGIVVPTLDSITSSRVVMVMDEYIRTRGYTPLIINTNHNELRELKSIESLWKLKVDGIVLLATDVTMAHQKIASKLDIPLLFVAQRYNEGYCIVYDDYHAGYEVGSYVADMGHTNILYLGVNRKDEAVGVIRKNGIYDALHDHGIKHIPFIETTFSLDNARKMISQYLDKHHPTCIIAATDNIALGCYKEINDRGLKIPDDISLVGFGGYEVSALVSPSLTTIRFENEDAGCMAGKAIIDLIENQEVENKQHVGYTFIIGNSVKNIMNS